MNGGAGSLIDRQKNRNKNVIILPIIRRLLYENHPKCYVSVTVILQFR